MARIYRKKATINQDKTLNFFESRGKHFNAECPLTSILYQDKNPDLAKERDIYEKKIAIPLLRLKKDDDILDVGCGIQKLPCGGFGKVYKRLGEKADD